MQRVRWTALCLALFLAALVIIGAPSSVAAAGSASSYSYQDNSGTTQPPGSPMVSVPGIFSLSLGESSGSRSGGLGLGPATLDLPALNATATVNGFSFNLRDGTYGWDSITVSQAMPVENPSLTISDMQANVQGPAANFSTDLSATVDVHPNENVQAGATVKISYDGLTGQPAFGVADGSAQLAIGPANLTVDGVNTGDGSLAVDSAQVMFPDAGIGVRLDGYTMADGQSDWAALTWYGQEFNIGDVARLSDTLVIVPGASAAGSSSMGATTRFEVSAGDAASASGQLVFAVDQTTGQPMFGLVNGNVSLGASGWNLAVNGLNTTPDGTSVDSIVLTAEPLGVSAQVSGISTDPTSGMTFDQASFLYQPDQSAGQTTVAGFQLVVDNTDAGYIVSTTTLLPTAKAQ